MILLFCALLIVLILAELVKGLSANGTPPVLQKFSWQLDLAWAMWSSIGWIRIALLAMLAVVLWQMSAQERADALIPALVLTPLWAFVYWLFNLFWVGKYKFDPLKDPTFATADKNQVAPSAQVIGVDLDGVQKAWPVSMLFYHHQVPDTIGERPIWVTYCGLCRSGRVYDRVVDGQALDFELVGAITFNAVFRDRQTNSWWRQETGQAARGRHAGKALADVPMQQMSLKHWLAQHPDSQVLQYDPDYRKRYDFVTALMNYEASLPGWHMQQTPPLIVGLEIDGQERAYDWAELKKRRLVMDSVGERRLLLLSSQDGSSAFAFDRTLDGKELQFEIEGDELTDKATGSRWNLQGQCVEGELKGSALGSVQIYQQFIRAWASFHPDSTYYDFYAN